MVGGPLPFLFAKLTDQSFTVGWHPMDLKIPRIIHQIINPSAHPRLIPPPPFQVSSLIVEEWRDIWSAKPEFMFAAFAYLFATTNLLNLPRLILDNGGRRLLEYFWGKLINFYIFELSSEDLKKQPIFRFQQPSSSPTGPPWCWSCCPSWPWKFVWANSPAGPLSRPFTIFVLSLKVTKNNLQKLKILF